MNNNLKLITTIMIIILILVLILIAITYFNSREIVDTKVPYVSNSSGEKKNIEEKELDDIIDNMSDEDSIQIVSGESVTTNITSGELNTKNDEMIVKNVEEFSGDDKENQKVVEILDTNVDNNIAEINSSGENEKEEITVNDYETPYNTKDKEPVITSSSETSNQEKQQILNELDDALQGLLEAVGKVPTVDEEKLDASLKESEVQP